jgi:hypothetical protein
VWEANGHILAVPYTEVHDSIENVWLPHQPDNYMNHNQICLSLATQKPQHPGLPYGLDDISCTSHWNYYICEKNAAGYVLVIFLFIFLYIIIYLYIYINNQTYTHKQTYTHTQRHSHTLTHTHTHTRARAHRHTPSASNGID